MMSETDFIDCPRTNRMSMMHILSAMLWGVICFPSGPGKADSRKLINTNQRIGMLMLRFTTRPAEAKLKKLHTRPELSEQVSVKDSITLSFTLLP
mmetsp:Transcript_2557/g.4731  ORF Transcript_2557/g.4731 Transcript_2557/m.4731 type:complete len:95 (+) Transcript_2557:490-774(+)